MSKLKSTQILKQNATVKAKKLTAQSTSKIIKETKEKQDFILSLKLVDEKSLKSVVQL